MGRIDIGNDRVWVSDKVYYHILDLEKRLELCEKELKKVQNEKYGIPLEIKADIYKSLMQGDTDNNYKNLVKLLEEIADFKTTNKIEDEDKVIVLLPETSVLSKIFTGDSSNE